MRPTRRSAASRNCTTWIFGPPAQKTARRARTIATIIDYLTPFLSDPHKWVKEQVIDFQTTGLYALAFAGMGLKRPEYVALYRKLDAPAARGRLLSIWWSAAGKPPRIKRDINERV